MAKININKVLTEESDSNKALTKDINDLKNDAYDFKVTLEKYRAKMDKLGDRDLSKLLKDAKEAMDDVCDNLRDAAYDIMHN